MKLIERLKLTRITLFVSLYHLLPVRKNKILLWANSFKSYGCSPKYIAQYLLEHCPGRFDLVWVFSNEAELPKDLPDPIRVVRYFSIDYLKEISTAKVIICNARTGDSHFFRKRKEQFYIQTWHSSLRLKKVEGDAEKLPESYVRMAKKDSEKIDLLLSGCDFSTAIFQRAFWYFGEILKSGTPRCDLFFKDMSAIREKVFNRYGLNLDIKLALYAPTFRDDKKAHLHGLDCKALQKALSQKTDKPWVIGCRLHPNIHEQTETVSGVVSMTHYPDMQELIAAADCLITDYSSCMFDAAVAGKPCILYAPDCMEYVQKERGLYFDIASLPFELASTNAELIEKIITFNKGKYERSIQRFLQETGSYEDGMAAKRVVERILKLMENQHKYEVSTCLER